VSTDRSFSKLKVIKNYLRSEMTRQSLPGLAVLSIENDICKIFIPKDDIIDHFVAGTVTG